MLKPREARHSVLIRARMRAGGPVTEVCVRNVSTRGMMLQAQQVPAMGTYVEIMLPDEVVVGRVMWTGDRRFGIRSRDRVPLHKLIGPRAGAAQAAPCVRSRPATAAPVRREARMTGRSMEFFVLAACGVAIAGLAAAFAFKALSSVTEKISPHL